MGSKFPWVFPGCFLPSPLQQIFVSLKSKTGLRGRGKVWLIVNVRQCRDCRWGGNSAGSCCLHQDPGDRVSVTWPEAAAAFFCCVSFKARCLTSLWISSGENLSLINNCLCWIYRWAKPFPLMLQFSTFSSSGLHEHWHLKEINLPLR